MRRTARLLLRGRTRRRLGRAHRRLALFPIFEHKGKLGLVALPRLSFRSARAGGAKRRQAFWLFQGPAGISPKRLQALGPSVGVASVACSARPQPPRATPFLCFAKERRSAAGPNTRLGLRRRVKLATWPRLRRNSSPIEPLDQTSITIPHKAANSAHARKQHAAKLLAPPALPCPTKAHAASAGCASYCG